MDATNRLTGRPAAEVIFWGDDAEFARLVDAVARNCTTHGCPIVDPARACAACALLLRQEALDRLLWGRWLAPQLVAEEWRDTAAPA